MAFSIYDDDRLLGLLNAAIYLNVKSFRSIFELNFRALFGQNCHRILFR
jgi:hypothetical protein